MVEIVDMLVDLVDEELIKQRINLSKEDLDILRDMLDIILEKHEEY